MYQYVSYFSLIQKATKEKFLDNYWECHKWRHKLKRKGREKEMMNQLINNCEKLKYYLSYKCTSYQSLLNLTLTKSAHHFHDKSLQFTNNLSCAHKQPWPLTCCSRCFSAALDIDLFGLQPQSGWLQVMFHLG